MAELTEYQKRKRRTGNKIKNGQKKTRTGESNLPDNKINENTEYKDLRRRGREDRPEVRPKTYLYKISLGFLKKINKSYFAGIC